MEWRRIAVWRFVFFVSIRLAAESLVSRRRAFARGGSPPRCAGREPRQAVGGARRRPRQNSQRVLPPLHPRITRAARWSPVGHPGLRPTAITPAKFARALPGRGACRRAHHTCPVVRSRCGRARCPHRAAAPWRGAQLGIVRPCGAHLSCALVVRTSRAPSPCAPLVRLGGRARKKNTKEHKDHYDEGIGTQRR